MRSNVSNWSFFKKRKILIMEIECFLQEEDNERSLFIEWFDNKIIRASKKGSNHCFFFWISFFYDSI